MARRAQTRAPTKGNDATLAFERKLISDEIRIQDAEKYAEVAL